MRKRKFDEESEKKFIHISGFSKNSTCKIIFHYDSNIYIEEKTFEKGCDDIWLIEEDVFFEFDLIKISIIAKNIFLNYNNEKKFKITDVAYIEDKMGLCSVIGSPPIFNDNKNFIIF